MAMMPTTLLRLAIEEGEAWLLGDRAAVTKAYPDAKRAVLDAYVQDSICGTWERLADAVFEGGARELARLGWPQVGREKCAWAQAIAPYVDVERNASKSFQVFRDGLCKLAGGGPAGDAKDTCAASRLGNERLRRAGERRAQQAVAAGASDLPVVT